ncbi:MAG: hypothetical protein ABIK62_06540, partial [candidate division WOR-3 bacterium]
SNAPLWLEAFRTFKTRLPDVRVALIARPSSGLQAPQTRGLPVLSQPFQFEEFLALFTTSANRPRPSAPNLVEALNP